jgi:hypothetical protein
VTGFGDRCRVDTVPPWAVLRVSRAATLHPTRGAVSVSGCCAWDAGGCYYLFVIVVSFPGMVGSVLQGQAGCHRSGRGCAAQMLWPLCDLWQRGF